MGLFFNIVVRYIKGLGPVPDVDEGKFLNNFNKEKEMEKNLMDLINIKILMVDLKFVKLTI